MKPQPDLGRRRARAIVAGAESGAETLTLVYGARHRRHNDAVVLAEILRTGIERSGREKG